jgi:hypothetical protein
MRLRPSALGLDVLAIAGVIGFGAPTIDPGPRQLPAAQAPVVSQTETRPERALVRRGIDRRDAGAVSPARPPERG